VEVIVTSGEGGTKQQMGDDLYIRDMAPPKARLDDDEACDGIEVVFETTNMVMNTPTLEKKVPGGTWQAAGTATEELLLWNGTDAVTVPRNIVHCPHRAP